MDLDYKIASTILGIIIAIIGYYFYLIDIYKGKNKPHLYSWLTWSTVLGIGFFISLSNNGGYGSIVIGIDSLFCLIIALISIKKGEQNITKSDKISLFGAFVAIILWLVFSQALLSVILLIIIDLFGIIPTFRKSYKKPNEESISIYIATFFIFGLAIIGLNEYTFITYGYLLFIILFDTSLVFMILSRRKLLKKEK